MSIFEAYATVVINVQDVNDECPTLNPVMLKYNGNPDVGDVLGRIQSIDNDSLSTYTVLSNDYFECNAITGDITVKKKFPYSYKETFSLGITATDSNNCPQANSRLTIYIETCNDPEDYQFKSTRYTRTYKEDRALGYLLTVAVRSTSVARNFSIVYIPSDPRHYEINQTTGKISFCLNSASKHVKTPTVSF